MDAPPVTASVRPRFNWWWMLPVPVLGGLAVLYFFNPSQYGFYPRCPLYTTTGIYCPGCGSQRALYYLLHGKILYALRCNVLLIAGLPFVAFYSLRAALLWARGKPVPRFTPSPLAIAIGSVVLVIFTILRNIPFAPFNYLAPGAL